MTEQNDIETPDANLVELVGVTKAYGDEPVLRGCDLRVAPGDSLAITGPSGCGKTTLLNLIGAMDRADDGRVLVAGRDVGALNEREGAAMRRDRLGFVFQHHHLLPQCTALENVLLPVLAGRNRVPQEVTERARALLVTVGLEGREHHRPGELSGGQRQRVAVVRALINEPDLLLADEPTGSLDESAAEHLVELLLDFNRQRGLTLMVVTHDPVVAGLMRRQLALRAGRLHEPTAGGVER